MAKKRSGAAKIPGGPKRPKISAVRKVAALKGLKIGDRVLIKHFGGQSGRIVEFRGQLGPGGSRIYRVRIRRKPSPPTYIEVREDQLELIAGQAGQIGGNGEPEQQTTATEE
jgi:hypothetical protein